MIKINHYLKALVIEFNRQIGDEGIAVIAGALNNANISELNVSTCGIKVAGAKALAAGLLNNHTIKSLNVRHNAITVDGAIAILEAAVTSEVCQEVAIDNMSDYRVKNMLTNLNDRKRQKVLL